MGKGADLPVSKKRGKVPTFAPGTRVNFQVRIRFEPYIFFDLEKRVKAARKRALEANDAPPDAAEEAAWLAQTLQALFFSAPRKPPPLHERLPPEPQFTLFVGVEAGQEWGAVLPFLQREALEWLAEAHGIPVKKLHVVALPEAGTALSTVRPSYLVSTQEDADLLGEQLTLVVTEGSDGPAKGIALARGRPPGGEEAD